MILNNVNTIYIISLCTDISDQNVFCVLWKCRERGRFQQTYKRSTVNYWKLKTISSSYIIKGLIHFIISDFLKDLSILWSDIEGGYNWFSLLKNMAISPCPNWWATHQRLNKLKLFFHPSSFVVVVDLFLVVWMYFIVLSEVCLDSLH